MSAKTERYRLTMEFEWEPTTEVSVLEQVALMVANIMPMLADCDAYPDLVTFQPVREDAPRDSS